MAEAMTPGKYRAKATDHKWGETSKKTEQIYVEFEITSGPFAGQHMPWYGYFTESTAERTMEALEYAGWDGESLRELKGLGSKEVELVVEYEKGTDDRDYLRVRWVNRPAGGVKVLLNPAQVASLEQRMKGLMLKRKQGRPAGGSTREPGEDFDQDFGPTDYGDDPPT